MKPSLRTLIYQAKILADEAKKIIIEKSRQIGMSEYIALKAVRDCVRKAARLDWWVLSRDETQAKLFLETCVKWAKLYDTGARQLGVEVIEGSNAYTLEFSSGVKIHALSSNPDALAGKTGNVVLDEFALHKDQQLLLKVASGTITWGGILIVLSTHRGVNSVFSRLIKQVVQDGNPMGWSHHKITIDDAINDGIVEAINAKTGSNYTRAEFRASKRADCYTQNDFDEEFMAIPRNSEGQLVPWDNIIKAILDGCLKPDWRQSTNPLYLGNDVARKMDLHCHCILEKIDDICYLREIAVQDPSDKSWASRDAKLAQLLDSPIIRAAIDQTGVGDKYVDDAQRRHGTWRIHGVIFNNAVKAHLAENLARGIETGKLRIPDDDRLIRHISAIAKGHSKTGMITYDADHSVDGHADLFWALALAYDAATSKPTGAWTSELISNVISGVSKVRNKFTPKKLR